MAITFYNQPQNQPMGTPWMSASSISSGGGGGAGPAPPQTPQLAPLQAPTNVYKPQGVSGPMPGYSAGKITSPAQLMQNPWSQAAQASSVAGGQAAGQQGQANIGQAGQMRNAATQGYGAAGQILNTAFDPQQGLYNRTAQQLQDQVRVGQSARGITSSPYGAGLEDQAMSNFNLDWQDRQLGRQQTGMQGFATGVGAGGGAAMQAGNLGQQGVGQTQQVGQMPYDTSQGQAQDSINNWIAYMNQANAATSGALQNYPNQVGYSQYGQGGGYTPAPAFGY